MGYQFIIGEKIESNDSELKDHPTAQRITVPGAPSTPNWVIGHFADQQNISWIGYTAFSRFDEAVKFTDILQLGTQVKLSSEISLHDTYFSITPIMLEKMKQKSIEMKDSLWIKWIEWFVFWFKYSLKNCQNPILVA